MWPVQAALNPATKIIRLPWFGQLDTLVFRASIGGHTELLLRNRVLKHSFR